ncbi:hypothetical protein DFH09DRAFT_1320925 [Mycena vulgaris]|nr:hypothetical protein DFH09DRAFT_1320925 [Mycena vulgaris]
MAPPRAAKPFRPYPDASVDMILPFARSPPSAPAADLPTCIVLRRRARRASSASCCALPPLPDIDMRARHRSTVPEERFTTASPGLISSSAPRGCLRSAGEITLQIAHCRPSSLPTETGSFYTTTPSLARQLRARGLELRPPLPSTSARPAACRYACSRNDHSQLPTDAHSPLPTHSGWNHAAALLPEAGVVRAADHSPACTPTYGRAELRPAVTAARAPRGSPLSTRIVLHPHAMWPCPAPATASYSPMPPGIRARG